MKSYPLLELSFNHFVIDCVLRTRRARSGFVLLRTLDARGNATKPCFASAIATATHRTILPLVFKFF